MNLPQYFRKSVYMLAGLLLGIVNIASNNEKFIDSRAAEKEQSVKIIEGGSKITALKAIPLSS